MKRLLLLTLAAIPLFGFSVNFIICDYGDYGYYEDDYWCDEYWCDDYWNDGYWVYYPHGYYCVRYVWWYPWWWDWYWHRCHWVSHFHWDFFYAGFYVVWYDGGCWWFRPRYGRWVRYRLPYSYHEICYRAKKHGIHLPTKPPREINVPYKDKEVRKLVEKNDPELYKRVEKEHNSGNLEKMRKDYTQKVEREIAVKNEEYRTSHNNVDKRTTFDQGKPNSNIPTSLNRSDDKDIERYNQLDVERNNPKTKSESHLQQENKRENEFHQSNVNEEKPNKNDKKITPPTNEYRNEEKREKGSKSSKPPTIQNRNQDTSSKNNERPRIHLPNKKR